MGISTSTALGVLPGASELTTIELPRPRTGVRQRGMRRFTLGAVDTAEDVVHFCVVLVLMTVAAMVLCYTIYDLVTTRQAFPQAATTAVNGVLFAIIIMEVMRTVLAHFERGGLQLQPFLIIGIISAVREILSVGAHLSLQGSGEGGMATIHLALLELAVNGGLVLGLVASLVLVCRLVGMRSPSDGNQI